MGTKIKCALCGTETTKFHHRQKYCGKICKDKANSQRSLLWQRMHHKPKMMECEDCGKTIKKINGLHRFCSECREKRVDEKPQLLPMETVHGGWTTNNMVIQYMYPTNQLVTRFRYHDIHLPVVLTYDGKKALRDMYYITPEKVLELMRKTNRGVSLQKLEDLLAYMSGREFFGRTIQLEYERVIE